MIKKCLFLFPNQLIHNHPLFKQVETIFLIEHPIFFNNKTKKRKSLKLNKLRCAYHRITQDIWTQENEKKYKIKWCKLKKVDSIPWPSKKEIQSYDEIHILDVADDDLLQQIKNLPIKKLIENPSPVFIFSKEELEEYIESKKDSNPMRHSSFYSWGRKKKKILVTKNDTMEGGKLSWDTSNRNPLPSSEVSKVIDSCGLKQNGKIRLHSIC